MWAPLSLNEMQLNSKMLGILNLTEIWNIPWIPFCRSNKNVKAKQSSLVIASCKVAKSSAAEHSVQFYFSLAYSWVVTSFEMRESHLFDRNRLFFLKAPFSNDGAASSFHLWFFLTSLVEMWNTLAVWRLEPVRPLAVVKFELTGGFVLCLLSLCASGCVAPL